jgi:hypothetical protein
MLLFLLLGAAAFVTDVVNPATATPLIWPRVVVLSFLILQAIRFLVILPDFGITVAASRRLIWLPRPHSYSEDVLALYCTRLR